jgi:hypothetical protein
VTVSRRGHRRATVSLHHSTILAEEDCREHEGVPITSVARTVLDLAISRSEKSIERSLEKMERHDLLDVVGIDAVLLRSGRHPGRKPLARAMIIYRDPVFARVRLERLFLAAVLEAELPRPAINTFVAGYEIDAYWDAERFAVELDGWETHGTRAAFERDPVRLEELKLAGIDAIRLTAARVEGEPQKVTERLKTLLAQRRRDLGR